MKKTEAVLESIFSPLELSQEGIDEEKIEVTSVTHENVNKKNFIMKLRKTASGSPPMD